MKRKSAILFLILFLSATGFSQNKAENPMMILEEFLQLIQANRFQDAEKIIRPLFPNEDDYDLAKKQIKFIADNELKPKYILKRGLSDKTGYLRVIFQGIDFKEFDCRILLVNYDNKWRILDISIEKNKTKFNTENPSFPTNQPRFLTDPLPGNLCLRCG